MGIESFSIENIREIRIYSTSELLTLGAFRIRKDLVSHNLEYEATTNGLSMIRVRALKAEKLRNEIFHIFSIKG